MPDLSAKLDLLKKSVASYPDFPKKGVLFRDMFSLFQNPDLTILLRDVLLEFTKSVDKRIDAVAGLDARGFILAPIIALELKVPFIPLRKKGKLPGNTISVSYSLEYGENTLEIQADGSLKTGQNILIVDDLLATGGSLGAACDLVHKVGYEVAACLVLIELEDLKGREKVPADLISILKY